VFDGNGNLSALEGSTVSAGRSLDDVTDASPQAIASLHDMVPGLWRQMLRYGQSRSVKRVVDFPIDIIDHLQAVVAY
jgi:hypothetical protein